MCNAIAVLGTASDVGKSIVATALCRIFRNAGIDVAPFKAQNMSNNSGVTPDGLEMGRAQIVQAEAARVAPTADMNPVLLKPNTDTGAQVVLQGKVSSTESAKGYFRDTSKWAAAAFESLHRLMEKHELLVIEGAGSCAEMNLYERDFVNFRTAREAGASVILVADIDRGGVFAQVVGTLSVIPPEDRLLVKGVIINRFRGDIELFRDGVEMIEKMAGIPVLGVIPYFRGFTIDAEDAVPLSAKVDPTAGPASGKIGVAVIYFPHISNFTDLSPLEEDSGVDLHYLHYPRSLDGYHMLVLPGSKNVRGDLDWLRSMGWEEEIMKFRRRGGLIMGICGGFQMLGESIADPYGLEGEPGRSSALGLLPVATELEREKYLSNSVGRAVEGGARASGYEIHMGRTAVSGACTPFLHVTGRNGVGVEDTDGVVSVDERVIGTYFHGVFDEPGLRSMLLRRAGGGYASVAAATNRRSELDGKYDMLAEHFSRHLDLDKVFALAGQPVPEVKKLSNLYHHTHGGAPSGGVEVTDFSVNISPLFPPLGPLVMEERDLIAYPSIDGGGIRDFYEKRFALEPGSVLGTNGAAEGIYLLPRALGLRHVLVPAPSFFEYERACRIAGAEVSVVELKEENGFAMPEFQELVDRVENVDAFFAANPNNPTGTRLAPAVVLALASRFPDKWFLVDEAFIQFTADFPSNSLMREVLAFRNVVVVHSLTKFYALPGLRLGAVIAHPDVIGRLLEHKEPWTVNAVAERVAGRLSGCLEWEESVRQLAGLERERIWRECASIECMSLFGGVANFFLARWDGSLDHLLARLKEQGMPVRDCRNFRGLEGEWFRFAVRWPEENSRLIAALREASDD